MSLFSLAFVYLFANNLEIRRLKWRLQSSSIRTTHALVSEPDILLLSITATNKLFIGAHRAHIALAELGLPFEEEIIDLSAPRTAEYLAINPRGLVPSLSYNGQIITESAVVSQFLVDAYPSHLVPTAGSPDAALQVHS